MKKHSYIIKYLFLFMLSTLVFCALYHNILYGNTTNRSMDIRIMSVISVITYIIVCHHFEKMEELIF